MDVVRFKIDGKLADNLTWDDIEILEAGKVGKAKNILARFVVDDTDKSIPVEEAKKILGKLKMSQVEETMQRFLSLMNDSAVNPPNAAPS